MYIYSILYYTYNYGESPGKFDSRTLNRTSLSRRTGRTWPFHWLSFRFTVFSTIYCKFSGFQGQFYDFNAIFEFHKILKIQIASCKTATFVLIANYNIASRKTVVFVLIVNYECTLGSAKMTPVQREAVLLFVEPRRRVASNYSNNVPHRVCGDVLKPCQKHSCSGYIFVMYYSICVFKIPALNPDLFGKYR